MGAFSTKELALEALEEVRNKVVKKWGVQVSRIGVPKDDAFMVLDETYYLNKFYLNTYVTEYTPRGPVRRYDKLVLGKGI